MIDLTGQRFGKLVVISRAKNKGQQPYWKCKCDCGNEKEVSGSNLRRGQTKSCGCIRKEFEDLTGQIFSDLTVISRNKDYIKPNGKHEIKWVCQCACGNISIVSSSKLKSGHTRSCGCLCKKITSKRMKKYNDYIICNNYVIMYTMKNEPFLVDIDDFGKVKDICWHKDKDGYITGYINSVLTLLSRYIMNCPDGMDVDHKYGSDTLFDNRKSNLRVVTRGQNNMNKKKLDSNTSGVTGVCWSKRDKKWIAKITVNYKHIYLGSYVNFDDAVRARINAENKYFGEWSCNNSRKEQEMAA